MFPSRIKAVRCATAFALKTGACSGSSYKLPILIPASQLGRNRLWPNLKLKLYFEQNWEIPLRETEFAICICHESV